MRAPFPLLALALAAALLAPAAAHATISFSPSQTLTPASNGGNPIFIASGRLSGSGNVDLVMTSCGAACGTAGSGNGGIHIFKGSPNGTFTQDTANSVNALSRFPYGIALGDVDHNGQRDLAVAMAATSQVEVYTGSPTGTYTLGSTLIGGTRPVSTVLADLDNDGDLDMAAANQNVNTVTVNLSNGNGTFVGSVGVATFPPNTGLNSITAGDFNADGKKDLLVTSGSGRSYVLRNSGTNGTTFTATTFPAALTPVGGLTYAVPADLNNDGNLDVLIADQAGDAVRAALGDGTAVFGDLAPRWPAGGLAPTQVLAADIDNDGKLDAVTANCGDLCTVDAPSPGGVGVLRGYGNGSFAPGQQFPSGNAPQSLAVDDFNRDGALDVATANRVSGDITVLLARPVVAAGGADFGGQVVGRASPVARIVVTNTGVAPLTISSAAVGAGDFAKVDDGCSGTTVPQDGTCSIGVRVTPSAAGALAATLTLTDNAAVTTQSLGLSATGVPADAGPAGSNGAQGPAGANGANGGPGPTGATGPRGATGKTGAPGRDAVVTCKVGSAKKGKVKVTCTVTKAKAKSRVAVRLTRSGKTVASGSTTLVNGRVAKTLSTQKSVKPGRYTLGLTFTADGTTTKRSLSVLVG